jgi:hypothetical protein
MHRPAWNPTLNPMNGVKDLVLGRLNSILAAAMLTLCACDILAVYDREIEDATRAIATAGSDSGRAAAYSDRGRAYSDKARLSMLRKTIDHDEYVRLFGLAIADHERAVALDPGGAEVWFKRGLTSYDRAALVDEAGVDHEPWFDSARADFSKAIERDPRDSTAYDYLGLVDEQTGRMDDAISDYSHEMALDSRLGAARLAELYCSRGQSFLEKKRYDDAAADLEKSIEYGSSDDGCSCEPYNSLAFIYVDAQPQYDKAWELVRNARSLHRSIAPEYVERLKSGSGRNG